MYLLCQKVTYRNPPWFGVQSGIGIHDDLPQSLGENIIFLYHFHLHVGQLAALRDIFQNVRMLPDHIRVHALAFQACGNIRFILLRQGRADFMEQDAPWYRLWIHRAKYGLQKKLAYFHRIC